MPNLIDLHIHSQFSDGQYDIRMLNVVLKIMLGKYKIEVSDLPKINPLKIHEILNQLVDGINAIPDVPEYYSEREKKQIDSNLKKRKSKRNFITNGFS